MDSNGSGDQNRPMRRPVRRPSLDSSFGGECRPPLRLNSGNHQVCVTEYEDDDDDDATQVTSNQQQQPQESSNSISKQSKRGSNTFTEPTAKSSHCSPTPPPQPPTTEKDEDCHSRFDDLQSKPGEIRIDPTSSRMIMSADDKPTTMTEESIRAFMVDYYEDWGSILSAPRSVKTLKECFGSFLDQYCTPDLRWIRPSGNPLNKEGLIEMMSEHIVSVRAELVSIESIQLLAGGMAAVVVFTADQEYLYKGQAESDRCITTAVLHMEQDGNGGGGVIRIGHEHRCVGKPIPVEAKEKPKTARWES